MNNPVEPFIVRILSENGDVQGAGFMVSRRQVLTCAHVVADATETSRTEAQAPAGQIHLDFPFAHASEQRLTGRVVHWLPVRDAQTSSTSLVEDIAVIELDCEAPERRQPAKLFVRDDLSGHNFSAYGFPSGHDTGHTAYGVIKEPDARGWVQIEGTSGQGYFVTRGFSGGPVWDQELNGVVGMIVGADRNARDTRVSFMIPAKLLAEAWSELHPALARFSPFMVDDLAEDFVRRPDKLNMAIASLTGRKQQRTMVSLHGAGGYGKTTLAKAICHDPRIREEFADGILWVGLGETPGDLTDRFQMLLHALGENHKAFSSKNLAASRLRELLADRRVLLVIDDVWDPSDLKDFVRGGPNCAYLITTRNLDALPDASSKIVVDDMKLGEATELLAQGLKSVAISDLERLAPRLGKWPLLLKLVNRFLRYRTEDAKQPLAETLDYVTRRLASPNGVTAFDMRNARERHQAVSITLQLSLELLSGEEGERYFELAIFPEDTDIPLPTLAKLWESTGGLDDFATEELCDRLYKLSLLLSLNLETMRVRLHDVLRKYLNSKLDQGQLSSIHQRLLDAHRPAAGWADLAPGDYLWDNLIAHLVAAQRDDELVETARDLSYLAATAFFRSPQSAEALLQTALDKTPDDAVLPPLKRFFIQIGHLLRRCQSREEMEALLRARLQCDGALTDYAKSVNWRRPSSHLAPWHTLPDQPHPSLIRTLSGHTDWIRNCALSQDGETLVSASDDCSLEVWDVKTGLPRFSLFGHTDKVFSCAINLSEKVSLIVSGSMDQTLKVWDARNGAELRTLKGHNNTVRCCAISPDGAWIVSGSLDGTLKVWDARTGKLRTTLKGHEKGIWDCKISSDGEWIISASMDKTVKVWGAKSWKQSLSLEGHQDEVRCCAISSDSRWIVSGSMDGTVRVWDMRTGREHLSPLRGHRDTVLGVAISQDGKTIVSASRDKTLKVWDLGARTCLQTLTGHMDGVNACVINRDCSVIISASKDKSLKVWAAASSAPSQDKMEGHRDVVNSCAISGDGSWVVTGSQDKTLKLWNTGAGKPNHTLSGHKKGIWCCAISQDNSWIVSGAQDRTLILWDARRRARPKTLVEHQDSVWGCAINHDGTLVVSASRDSTLGVWKAQTDPQLHRLIGHSDALTACALSADGKLIVSGSFDGTLKVWDAKEGHLINTISGHSDQVLGCAISRDGSWLVSTSKDKTLRIWQTERGAMRLLLRGHLGDVRGCAISPDELMVASVSEDSSLKIWEIGSGICLTTFYAEGPLFDCAWHPASRRIVAVGSGGVYFLELVKFQNSQ